VSQQLFIQEHAGAFALVVGAIGANLALEWFVTARERMAGAGGRGRAAVLGGTLIEVSTSRAGAGATDDRGTKRLLVGSMVAGLVLGWVAAAHVAGATFPAWLCWPAVVTGAALILAGGGLRSWGIATLGRFFRRDVTIQADHRVVIDGPYRLLRHPAYAGNLLAALGFGLALTNWVGLVIAVGVPLLGHLPRIRVEERAMAGALGQEWVGYAAGTARIAPGVW